ncbi:ferredoxin [Cognatishimia activa]|uniref:ferredoxin n=1 Tax=Cognatishimia activa TaxID=1715691 RepID=UPI00223213F3|nr:ferredoxin [Cognatishimia activa]UZD91218.1 ferredoxin [Cognatishimia activa]
MIESTLQKHALTIVGGFHPPDDEWFTGYQTALMIGPDEPEFWSHFTQQPEYLDGLPDGMDRFSKRVLQQVAEKLGGKVYFPSDGPPYPPFIQWALKSSCYQSPVGLLVHHKAGLFTSFRGVLALSEFHDLPLPHDNPCDSCVNQPCKTACPIEALTPSGYDVAACKTYIGSKVGSACLSGCKVRLSCPVSQNFGRVKAQSEFHMKAFVGE